MLEPIENTDVEIFFDEPTHKYTDQCGNVYTSVTTLIHKYVPEFKKDYWAAKKALEQNKTVKQVKKEWDNITDASCKKGTKEHGYLESAFNNNSIFRPKVITSNTQFGKNRVFSIVDVLGDFDYTSNIDYNKLVETFPTGFEDILPAIKYYVDKGYKIYSEINVFHPVYLIAGTIDLLLIKGTEFVIIDWKTGRKDIIFESGYYRKDEDRIETNIFINKEDKMKFPIQTIDNCNGMHYTLQLNIYAILLSCFGLECKALILYHIKDHYVLNKYGRPLVNKDGSYSIDNTKEGKNVKYYIISRLPNTVENLIVFHTKDVKFNLQSKLF